MYAFAPIKISNNSQEMIRTLLLFSYQNADKLEISVQNCANSLMTQQTVQRAGVQWSFTSFKHQQLINFIASKKIL